MTDLVRVSATQNIALASYAEVFFAAADDLIDYMAQAGQPSLMNRLAEPA